MIEVAPLKYGAVFKRAFSDPEIFSRFAQDILGIEFQAEQVHTEYEYPEPMGFVRSRYDLFAEDEQRRIVVEIQQLKEEDFFDRFLYYHIISMAEQVRSDYEYRFERTVYTIVVLTSIPHDGSVNFSYAVSDFSPVNERGETLPIYPHRLVFLAPRLADQHTLPQIRLWLDFISDSLDGRMEENRHAEPWLQKLLRGIRRENLSPGEWAAIKDEAAWEKAKARFIDEGRQEGREEGRTAERAQLIRNMYRQGLDLSQIADLTGLKENDIKALMRQDPHG